VKVVAVPKPATEAMLWQPPKRRLIADTDTLMDGEGAGMQVINSTDRSKGCDSKLWNFGICESDAASGAVLWVLLQKLSVSQNQHCKLSTADSALQTQHCKLSTAESALQTQHCRLTTADCVS
jgi:hypothetical protein